MKEKEKGSFDRQSQVEQQEQGLPKNAGKKKPGRAPEPPLQASKGPKAGARTAR